MEKLLKEAREVLTELVRYAHAYVVTFQELDTTARVSPSKLAESFNKLFDKLFDGGISSITAAGILSVSRTSARLILNLLTRYVAKSKTAAVLENGRVRYYTLYVFDRDKATSTALWLKQQILNLARNYASYEEQIRDFIKAALQNNLKLSKRKSRSSISTDVEIRLTGSDIDAYMLQLYSYYLKFTLYKHVRKRGEQEFYVLLRVIEVCDRAMKILSELNLNAPTASK